MEHDDIPHSTPPSTSTAPGLQETASGEAVPTDNAQLNETLEAFASTYNLSAQNVKNIIYHVLKNPQTLGTLIGKDREAVDLLRLTRARRRELERIAQTKLSIELKPIAYPKTFLDVEYGEDDVEDVDYNPEGEFADDNDSIARANAVVKTQTLAEDNEDEFPDESNPDWGVLNIAGDEKEVSPNSPITPRPGNSVEDWDTAEDVLLTHVDDPDYLQFINSCQLSSDPMLPPFNEEDDDEYNVIQDMGGMGEAEEEYRMDRTTRIPRWEVEALFEEMLTPNGEPLLKRKRPSQRRTVIADKAGRHDGIHHPAIQLQAQQQPQLQPSPAARNIGDPALENPTCGDIEMSTYSTADVVPSNDYVGIPTGEATVPTVADIGSSTANKSTSMHPPSSASLLSYEAEFTENEAQIFKSQLRKHIQLLTQCIVGTHGEPTLASVHNTAVEMIVSHDLNREQESRSHCPLLSKLDILQDAIVSCHDVAACRSVDLPCFQMGNEFTTPSFAPYAPPRNEVIWVLSRSRALRYPSLLPHFGFIHYETPSPKFLPTEQMLLAMALYQLKSVKHSNWKYSQGKYPLIAQHYLPNRTVQQIKNHMKNMRSSQNPSPIHEILIQAENGIFNAEFQLDAEVDQQQANTPIEWEERYQPEWLKRIAALYRQGMIKVVSTASVQESSSTRASPTPSADAPPSIAFEGGAPQSQILEGEKQKSRRRLRMERALQCLTDTHLRECARQALVEVIYADLKTRLFTHQDKLRQIQSLIASCDKGCDNTPPPQIFSRLAEICGSQHFDLLSLLASLLLPAPYIPQSLAPHAAAYRKVLEMFLDVQCYLSGVCRNVASTRNAFKTIKEDIAKEGGPTTERWLSGRLKQQFSGRDEPLWRLLKARLDSERWDERPEDWEFEHVNMERLHDDDDSRAESVYSFEQVSLPYHYDPSERGRLRLRHGRVTIEQNGRLKTANIGLITGNAAENGGGGGRQRTHEHKARDGPEESSAASAGHAVAWTREDDKLLLMNLNAANGNREDAVRIFKRQCDKNISDKAVLERLTFLLDLVRAIDLSSQS